MAVRAVARFGACAVLASRRPPLPERLKSSADPSSVQACLTFHDLSAQG